MVYRNSIKLTLSQLLRKWAGSSISKGTLLADVAIEAADEIEKLQQEIRALKDENDQMKSGYLTMAEHVAHSSKNEHWRRQAKYVLERG